MSSAEIREMAVFSFGDLPGDFAADRGDLPLQVPDTGLPGVEGDDFHGAVRDIDEFPVKGVFRDLLRDEVLARDLKLLLLRVSGKLDFHPVAKRRLNGIEKDLAVVMNMTLDRS